MRSPLWKYCSSTYLPKEHCTLYRDDDLGVQLQVMVKRDWGLIPPKAKCFYFIDGVDQVFKLEADLVHALEIRNVRRRVFRISPDRKNYPLVVDRSGGMPSRVSATR